MYKNTSIKFCIIIFLFSTVLLTLTYSCKDKEKTENIETPHISSQDNENEVILTPKQLDNAQLGYSTITSIDRSKELRLTGIIEVPPKNLHSISLPLGGYLKNLNILPGSFIKKGQKLGVIENIEFIKIQEEYLNAKEQLDFAEINLNRQISLAEQNATSLKLVQAATHDVNTQKIKVHSLKKRLSMIGINTSTIKAENITSSVTLNAKFDGYVTKIYANSGKYFTPSEVLVELVDNSDIHLMVNALQSDIKDIKIGQSISAFTNSVPDKKYGGKVLLLGKEVNDQGRIEIHCHLNRIYPELIPGMYMNVVIEKKSNLSPSLPSDAVVQWENKNYIFVRYDTNRFVMSEVLVSGEKSGTTFLKNFPASLQNKEIVVQNAYTLLMQLKNIEEEE